MMKDFPQLRLRSEQQRGTHNSTDSTLTNLETVLIRDNALDNQQPALKSFCETIIINNDFMKKTNLKIYSFVRYFHSWNGMKPGDG